MPFSISIYLLTDTKIHLLTDIEVSISLSWQIERAGASHLLNVPSLFGLGAIRVWTLLFLGFFCSVAMALLCLFVLGLVCIALFSFFFFVYTSCIHALFNLKPFLFCLSKKYLFIYLKILEPVHIVDVI